jgi:hypothetical protein
MPSQTVKSKKILRSKRKPNAKPMTKLEMVKKMLADQKIIREAIQSGTPLEQLEKTHGFTFARLPHIPGN